MTTTSDAAQAYVLGNSDRELARLERQATFFAGMTRDILERAGISRGMRVLDLGCGVGDVSSILADLVGPEGAVHGIDISEEAVGIASRRMQATGKAHAAFSVSTIEAFPEISGFDAVVGRFILVHMADPAGLVRSVAERAAPGTRLAFIEMDMSTAAALPPVPLLDLCLHNIMEVYRRAGRKMDMGAHLFATFRAAGLQPELTGLTRIASGSEEGGLDFVTESVRSLIPFMQKLGVASPEEIGIESLRDRLAEQISAGEHCIFYPRLVGAWATKG